MCVTALFLLLTVSFGLCGGESENEALDYTQLTEYKIQGHNELSRFIMCQHLMIVHLSLFFMSLFFMSLLHSPEEEQHYRLSIIDSGGPVVQREEISHQDTASKNSSFEYI